MFLFSSRASESENDDEISFSASVSRVHNRLHPEASTHERCKRNREKLKFPFSPILEGRSRIDPTRLFSQLANKEMMNACAKTRIFPSLGISRQSNEGKKYEEQIL